MKLLCEFYCRQMVLKLDNSILPPIYRYPEAEVHLVRPVMDVAKRFNDPGRINYFYPEKCISLFKQISLSTVQ